MEPHTLGHRCLNLRAASFLLVILLIIYELNTTAADPDLWGYLAFGRLFWGQWQFPYADVFAYVPTLNPWIYHEWLTGVVFYPLYRTLGAPALQVLKLTSGLATAGLIYLTARRRGADLLPTLLILWVSMVGMSVGYSPVRAQVFTYFFFAAYLYLLETARLSGQQGRLWLLVPIQVAWCNLHGGFLAGLGLIFLNAAGEALARRPFRNYLGWFFLAGLATLVNPYGLQYWKYLAQAVTMPRPEITEWVSLFKGYQQGLVAGNEMAYCLALISVTVLLALWARWREITPALVLLFTVTLAISHRRHEVFLALAFGAFTPPLLSRYFRELGARPGFMTRIGQLGPKLPTLAVLLLICLFAYRVAGNNPFKLELRPEPGPALKTGLYYPLGAIDYLEKYHLSGKLLVHFNWGEYCLWRLYPRCLVAIDGRYETVYPEDVCLEYFEFIKGGESWRQFVEHYPPDLILVYNPSKVFGRLSGDREWRQVYADPGCALFRRRVAVAPGGP